jgi:ferric-dicitrate binding protein FerR (iron transport regulator)
MPQGTPQGQDAAVSQDAPGGAAGAALIEALRDQVRQAQEQLRQAHDREQQAQEEKARLLTLLEVEQAARRELETKLLPAPAPPPKPAPPSHRRVWLLLILLVAVLAFAGWRWRDAIRAAMAALVN